MANYKITEITDEQKKLFPVYVEKYTKIGLSCEPADFETAKAAALRAYKLLELDEPEVVFCKSPKEARDRVVATESVSVNAAGYLGQFWSGWVAHVAFLRDELGWDHPVLERFTIEEDIVLSCGWVVWGDTLCAISDRPEFIHCDVEGRLHSDIGPAKQYRDGWALYRWHGTRVPKEWILTPEKVDPADVIKNENVEVRAAGAAILGWERMLDVLKAKVIDDSGNEDIGQLIELTLPGLDEPGRFLKARCPRNGVIVEGVPRVSDIDNLPIDTALAAQAWRIGDPQSEYTHPETRT